MVAPVLLVTPRETVSKAYPQMTQMYADKRRFHLRTSASSADGLFRLTRHLNCSLESLATPFVESPSPPARNRWWEKDSRLEALPRTNRSHNSTSSQVSPPTGCRQFHSALRNAG